MNKKHKVIENLYRKWKQWNDFIFHNIEVKKDASKLDLVIHQTNNMERFRDKIFNKDVLEILKGIARSREGS